MGEEISKKAWDWLRQKLKGMFSPLRGHGNSEESSFHESTGYVRVIHIDVVGSWADQPLEWAVDVRYTRPNVLCLSLNGASDPADTSVRSADYYAPYGGFTTNAYINSLGNGKYDIWIYKGQYDIIGVRQISSRSDYMADKVNITYPMDFRENAGSSWSTINRFVLVRGVNYATDTSQKAKQLINYYSDTRPTSADTAKTDPTGLYTFLATSSMTTNKPPADGVILNMPWDTDVGWTAQLFIRNSGWDTVPPLGYRYSNGSNAWSAWQRLPYYRVGDVIITSSNTNPQSYFGGTWTAMPKNYAFYKYPNSIANGAWNHSLTITTSGGAVFLNMNGNINPLNAGGWVQLHIKRDGTEIASQTVQSPASSSNTPYSISYIDVPSAGSHTYNFSMTVGSGTIQNNESGATYTPQMMAFELGASTNMYFWKRTA